MMSFKPDIPVYLHQQTIDFRKQINGLSMIVQESLLLDPFTANFFVFINRNRTRIKILYWDRNGFCLCDHHGWWEVGQRRSSCRDEASRKT